MSEVAVRLQGVGKMYRVYARRSATLVDGLGLSWLFPSRTARYDEFWALRGIDLELEAGTRLGIIGRNGAGKTTLLKLLTGGVAPTEGTIETAGNVQALLEASAGLHPEFTGRENIRAALTYQDLDERRISAAEEDIAEFTELGAFLDQPFRTYSSGMQARLGFAIATSVEPEILIVDEVLGAGDAYFLSKSIARMSRLLEGGASVLMVSHALDHIVRFCSEAIWLERGQIVERGPALEVVRAYAQFIRVFEERKLRAANRKARRNGDGGDSGQSLVVRLSTAGDPGRVACDVRAIRLLAGERVEDQVVVGGPQDSDTAHSAALVLDDGGEWSPPRGGREESFRTLTIRDDGTASATARFELDDLPLLGRNALEIVYRGGESDGLDVEVVSNGDVVATQRLSRAGTPWESARIPLPESGNARAELAPTQGVAGASLPRRWPGEGSIVIESVELLDESGRERAVFDVGTPLVLRVVFRAQREGRFEVVPTAVLYRLDGILVARFIGERVTLDLAEGPEHEAKLELSSLNLGDDDYVFNVALYKRLDINDIEPSEWYDLLDQSFRFRVVGTPPLLRGIFHHEGSWNVS
jgi:lipopolysaccharide transport system ATP-binding protein